MDDVDDCMDNMLENLGCMDLLESSDIWWDPSPLFEDEPLTSNPGSATTDNQGSEYNNGSGVELGSVGGGGGGGDHQEEDLGMVFFEWLKSNKETVSAEDIRNIKIKKSTIESAGRRLGGGKEGMKQLLKLILQWVQNHHLQTNPNPNPKPNPNPNPNHNHNNIPSNLNLNSNLNVNPNPEISYMNPPTWPAPAMCGDLYGNGYPLSIPDLVDYNNSWAPQAGPMHYGSFPDPGFGGYGASYPAGFYYHPGPGPGEGLARLGPSATKEARKKRMARQRRYFTHSHKSHSHSQSQSQSQSQSRSQQNANQHQSISQPNPTVEMNNPGHANWVYPNPNPIPDPSQMMHPVNGPGAIVGQMVPMQDRVGISGLPRQVGGVEKKQGWKTDKNLRFLLQKVLKQSDVGNLGRIVLPKKEAEMHLPQLEARVGISIAMEDIGTSRVWNMRYRFWPNNKSRMYLLENTGDFVRYNGLQEGDFIVIYSDVKSGKYMIRGVKVHPQDAKPEATTKINKPSKTQRQHF